MINNTKAIEAIFEEDKKFKEGNVKYDENMSSAQRVGFFNIGSGRVLDKILGSGSGSGRVTFNEG